VAGRVEWAPKALDDLVDIEEYIARDNRLAAERWVGRLITRAAEAAVMPKAARVVPEIGEEMVRETFLRDYRIIFRLLDDGIRVLRVIHGARRLRKLS
jgi:plasmid stabilization system protein ParE